MTASPAMLPAFTATSRNASGLGKYDGDSTPRRCSECAVRPSHPVAAPQASGRFPGPVVGGAGPIPAQHRLGPPAEQAHQVALLSTGQQEVMGVGVPEPVRVHQRGVQARTVGADLQPFTHTVWSEPSTLPEEQRGFGGVAVATAGTQVAIQRQPGLVAEVGHPHP